MDFIGVALAGMGEPLARILLEEVEEQGGRPQASMFRTGKKASLSQAPLVNGTAGHALDDDDVNSGCNGHPSTLLKLLREVGMGAVLTASGPASGTGPQRRRRWPGKSANSPWRTSSATA